MEIDSNTHCLLPSSLLLEMQKKYPGTGGTIMPGVSGPDPIATPRSLSGSRLAVVDFLGTGKRLLRTLPSRRILTARKQ